MGRRQGSNVNGLHVHDKEEGGRGSAKTEGKKRTSQGRAEVAEEEEERRYQPIIVRCEEGLEEDYDNADDEPLQPVECNFKGKMFCKTCFLFKKPESVWRSHHTSQMLACPTIPTEVKRELVEKYKRGES